MDVESVEKAEKQLNLLVEKRIKDQRPEDSDRAFSNHLDRQEKQRRDRALAQNRREQIDWLGHLHGVYLGHAERVASQRARLVQEGGYAQGGYEVNGDGHVPDGEAA